MVITTTPKIPQQNYSKFKPKCQCLRLNKGAKILNFENLIERATEKAEMSFTTPAPQQ